MSGPTFLCLHGLGQAASDWDGVRPGLERYGAVHAPELPRATVDGLRSRLAALSAGAIIVGHSLSAVVALRLAAATGSSVRALVLTGGFFPPARNGRSRGATLADYLVHRMALGRELAARPRRPQPRVNTARAMGSLAQLGARPTTFDAIATAVRVPVLVVHGEADHYVPVDFAIAASSRRPSWTIRTVERAGHSFHVDKPSDWLAVATPWLDHLPDHPLVSAQALARGEWGTR